MMRSRIALLATALVAACVSEPETAAPEANDLGAVWNAPQGSLEEQWWRDVRGRTDEELRAELVEAVRADDRRRIGFDGVSLDQRITELLAARGADEARRHAALERCMATRREMLLRKTAGAASCLPGHDW